jgi:hypothetical protein
MKKTFYLLICIVHISGCNNYNTSSKTQCFSETINLQGYSIGPEGLFLLPYRISALDSFFIIADYYPNSITNNVLYLYNSNTNEIELSFGGYGNGPGEIRHVSDVFINNNTKEIIVFDQIRNNFLQYNLDSLINIKNYYVPSIINVPPEYSDLYSFSKPNDSIFVSHGSENSLFVLFSKTGEILFELEKFPFVDFDIPNFKTNISKENLKFLLKGKIAYDSNLDRIIIAYLNFDLIEVYNLKGERLKYFINNTNYIPILQNELYNYHFCYYKVSTDEEYIYALYSGFELIDGSDDYRQGKTIQVFDKDLNPVRKYELDTPINSFVINKNNRIIYGLSSLSDTPLTVFKY